MLSNKKVNIVISLLIAVVLWAYVIGEINPSMTKTFNNVPINYINENYLTEQNMAISSISDTEINIGLKGERSKINRVKNADIIANVDLSGGAKGENEFKVAVKVPDNITVDSKSFNKVVVNLETLVSSEKDVKVVYTGKNEEGAAPITVEQDLSTVEISGAKSNVEKVEYLRAEIDGTKIGNKETNFKVNLVPVDKSGQLVKYIKLSSDTVNVKTVLGKTKTVDLEVPLIGENSGTNDKTVNVPKNITIKGRASIIDQIDKIKAQTIDLTGITESQSIDITPILPEGIEFAGKKDKLKVVVTVLDLENKTFNFDGSEITFTGLGINLKAKVKIAVTVTVSGKKSQLEAISKGDISLSVDCTGLPAGNKDLKIKGVLAKEHEKLVISPETVNVEIE